MLVTGQTLNQRQGVCCAFWEASHCSNTVGQTELTLHDSMFGD